MNVLETRDEKTSFSQLALRKVIEELLEAEVSDRLGRGYYERGSSGGHRNGYRTGRLKSAEGEVEYDVPQVRGLEEPFRSRIRPELGKRTEVLEDLAGGTRRSCSFLGPASKETAIEAMRSLEGVWWKGCATPRSRRRAAPQSPSTFEGTPLRTLARLEVQVEPAIANRPPFDALGPSVTQDHFPVILATIGEQNRREFGPRADRPD